MLGERQLNTKLLLMLLDPPEGAREITVVHNEGFIRGIVWVLTGYDIGTRCGDREGVQEICKLLGWGYWPYGESGWLIDWRDSAVDEAKLLKAGIPIDTPIPKEAP